VGRCPVPPGVANLRLNVFRLTIEFVEKVAGGRRIISEWKIRIRRMSPNRITKPIVLVIFLLSLTMSNLVFARSLDVNLGYGFMQVGYGNNSWRASGPGPIAIGVGISITDFLNLSSSYLHFLSSRANGGNIIMNMYPRRWKIKPRIGVGILITDGGNVLRNTINVMGQLNFGVIAELRQNILISFDLYQLNGRFQILQRSPENFFIQWIPMLRVGYRFSV